MKKTDGKYVLKWYGIPTAVMILLVALGIGLDLVVLVSCAIPLWIALLAFMPMILKKKLDKYALELEKGFPQRSFSYQQKFTAHNGVWYIDANGNIGVVWKYNPTELCMVDISEITDICTKDGRSPMGTSAVCCQFRLSGKKMRIYTLRVSGGTLAMKDPRVLEAISKADKLCILLNSAKANEGGGRTA